MDLTQLANLGEFIGGVAVLVTLIYLAVQMRQSNRIATADAVHNTANAFSIRRALVDLYLTMPHPPIAISRRTLETPAYAYL